MFSMFSVCLHLFRPSCDYVLIYSSEMCVVFFFRGGIFDDLCKSDTPSLTQDVSSSQGSTRNFLNKFLIGILRGAAFATRHVCYWWIEEGGRDDWNVLDMKNH